MNAYAINLDDPAQNPVARFANFASLLNILLPLALGVGALLFLAMMIIGGWTLLNGRGDPAAVKKAQAYFTYGIAGLVIMLGSVFIVRLIAQILSIGPLPF